jgi:hypothetical protein
LPRRFFSAKFSEYQFHLDFPKNAPRNDKLKRKSEFALTQAQILGVTHVETRSVVATIINLEAGGIFNCGRQVETRSVVATIINTSSGCNKAHLHRRRHCGDG